MVNTGNWGKCIQINGMIANEPASMKKEPQAYPVAPPSSGNGLLQCRGLVSNSDLSPGRSQAGVLGRVWGQGLGGLLFLLVLLTVHRNVGC